VTLATSIEVPSKAEGSSEPLTVGADPSPSVILITSPSISSSSLGTHSPTQSLGPASSKGSIGHHDSRSSLSLTSPQELALPSSSPEDLPSAIETHSVQLAPSLPVPSQVSCSPESQVPEKSERSVSPSRFLEDLQPLRSPSQLSSEPGTEQSSQSMPAGPGPTSEPPNPPAKTQRSIPKPSPLYLLPNVSDTILATPTTPTLSPSMCYSSLEISDSPTTTENGEFGASPISYFTPIKGRRADITPFGVKNGEEGFLCQETIIEGPESFPDDDDLDPFASPSSPSLPTVIPRPRGHRLVAAPSWRRTLSSFGRPKNRASTLGAPPSAMISKSASMVSLRRSVSSALFRRPRSRSAVSPLGAAPQSRPLSSLDVKMHNDSSISAEASQIDDDEVRRLSELAFMT
jgi:hypothetical protein